MRLVQIKVPMVKYQEAKRYQASVKTSGLNLPIWACMLENEKRNMQHKQVNDISKFYKRLI